MHPSVRQRDIALNWIRLRQHHPGLAEVYYEEHRETIEALQARNASQGQRAAHAPVRPPEGERPAAALTESALPA